MTTIVYVSDDFMYGDMKYIEWRAEALEELGYKVEHRTPMDLYKNNLPVNYGIMLFDYGGMSGCGCDSLITNWLEDLKKIVENNPNKLYLVISMVGSWMALDIFGIQSDTSELAPNCFICTGFEQVEERIKDWDK